CLVPGPLPGHGGSAMAEPGTGDRRPVITVFADSPDGGRGLARDMRVRWALEEVGEPYDVTPLTFAELRQPAHLVLQPVGQVPTFQGGGVALFESGAIVLHLAEGHPGLLPADPAARARQRPPAPRPSPPRAPSPGCSPPSARCARQPPCARRRRAWSATSPGSRRGCRCWTNASVPACAGSPRISASGPGWTARSAWAT